MRAREGGIGASVLDDGLRFKARELHGNEIILILRSKLDEGILQAVLRARFQLRAQAHVIIIAEISLVSDGEQERIIEIRIQDDHAHLISDLYSGNDRADIRQIFIQDLVLKEIGLLDRDGLFADTIAILRA